MASTVTSTNNLSLRSILEKDKLTGSNFLDWERNLMIVLRHERKWYVLEEPLGEAPPANAPAAARNAHKKHSDDLLDVACLMLATMSPDLQAGLINTNAYDMIRQLRDMFQTQARTERYDATKAFNECKMVKGTSLATDTILNSLSEDYRPFVVNYNMNNMEKTIAELHSMLKTAELNMGNKNKTKDVLMVKDGGVKNKNGQASTSKGKGPVQAIQSAPKKGKGKGKGKKVKPNKARTENRCFICNEVGHWRQNCPKHHEAAIDFSFVETTEAIERFLSYSVTDRRYRASKGGEESDVEPEVHVIEEKDMEGSASKKASTMEAAARAAKRKAAAQEGLVAKRTRSSYVSLDTPPKDAVRKVEGGIEAIPLSFAPPANEKGTSSQPASKVDKGKEKEGSGLTTMTINMPSDFMVDDVIRTKSIFPVLEQFHIRAQKARMEEADIEDLDASIAGISFLALQTSLSLHTRMAKIKEETVINQNDAKTAKKEAEKAKKKLAQLVDEVNSKSVQIGDLELKLEISDRFQVEQRERLKMALDRAKELEKDLLVVRHEKSEREEALWSKIQELEEDAALARVVARTALMRRVAAGTVTSQMASEEVASFVPVMGSEDLLDEEDLKGLDEETAVGEEKLNEAKDVSVEEEVPETSGSVPVHPLETEEASAADPPTS
ncbi:hypothetical protein OSB04_003192 [Centaurea solstitialis]|uniref:CCHC-type domain-containing protein n=1 Tax=Centaurea solstitialis TaxID=347529 RepID=A0AA38U6X0_9ASTR|nr:hypothetical protein OSB04_003192 [Centaurea solstitialis]